ncbi:MmgE/PrpD family protein [Paraburkholderia xenovorans]
MLLDTIAEYGAREMQRTLPPEVIHHAKRAFIDWLASIYPGTKVAPSLQLMAACQDELGFGKSSLPGNKTTTFPATAAWINGSVSHAVEFDDIYRDAVYHPGVAVVSAALAVAEAKGATGLDLLKAIVVGYEISTRIGHAVQPSHYKFFHTTGTVGSLGAAAAAAAICAPGNAQVMKHAIATAASMAAALQQAFRSDAMTKAIHAGHAAQAGVRAAQAAANGLTGVPDILEGEVGFGAALADEAHWERATAGLGEVYNITKVTQKNYACCGHAFASIGAILALRDEHGLMAANIASIHVEAYKATVDVVSNANPKTAFEAKFSLPYVVSHALVYGSVRLQAFEPERRDDPVLRDLMKRITLVEDPEQTARFPSQRSARMTVTTVDGQKYSLFQPYRKGDPEDPLTDGQINDKFMELATPVIGEVRAANLRKTLWELDTLELVGELQLARA